MVNVSTMAASFGLPGTAAYGASKAAVELQTKAWVAEYGPHGVRVNAVAPGPTRTPGTAGMGDGLDQLAATLPLGRPADAHEIARTIVFLASDDAAYVNGAILPVAEDEPPSEQVTGARGRGARRASAGARPEGAPAQ